MKLILLQNLYFNQRRDKEHFFCLDRNHANNQIDQIVLTVEKYDHATQLATAHRKKIKVIETGRKRETYAEMFSLAEQQTNSGDIVILANLDIFFDDSIRYLREFPAWLDTVMALTRWDYLENGKSKPFKVKNSQDAWIWRVPLRKEGMITDFFLGQPGCDNRIAYELSRNYRVVNPCKTVRCHHYHQSGCNDYTQVRKVPPPYKELPRKSIEDSLEERNQSENRHRRGIVGKLLKSIGIS